MVNIPCVSLWSHMELGSKALVLGGGQKGNQAGVYSRSKRKESQLESRGETQLGVQIKRERKVGQGGVCQGSSA